MSQEDVRLYMNKPDTFTSDVDVVGCIVEVRGEILLLQRQEGKPHPHMWGLPAGKIELKKFIDPKTLTETVSTDMETPTEAVLRELGQETGLWRVYKNHLQPIGTFYVQYPDCAVTFHAFLLELPVKFEVKLNPLEHKDFRWVTPDDALKMPLIGGLPGVLKHCYFRQ